MGCIELWPGPESEGCEDAPERLTHRGEQQSMLKRVNRKNNKLSAAYIRQKKSMQVNGEFTGVRLYNNTCGVITRILQS